jgi:hypothetical protein
MTALIGVNGITIFSSDKNSLYLCSVPFLYYVHFVIGFWAVKLASK